MKTEQMELKLDLDLGRETRFGSRSIRKRARVARASWWFSQMRSAVDRAASSVESSENFQKDNERNPAGLVLIYKDGEGQDWAA